MDAVVLVLSNGNSRFVIVIMLKITLEDPKGGTRDTSWIQFLSFWSIFGKILPHNRFSPLLRGWRPRMRNPGSATWLSNIKLKFLNQLSFQILHRKKVFAQFCVWWSDPFFNWEIMLKSIANCWDRKIFFVQNTLKVQLI